MNIDNMIDVILMVVTTFVVSLVSVPIAKKIAAHVGALDIPNDRKVHKKPMPRMGGLAIYFAFLVGYILFGQISSKMISILIGSFIILITGIVDDIKPIDAKVKIIGQFLAAIVVVFYGEILLKDISAFGIYLDFGIFYVFIIIQNRSTVNALFFAKLKQIW